jgi:hypothetical protein
VCAWQEAGFHWDNLVFTGIGIKKKKLTDIGFVFGFSWIGNSLVNGFGFLINVY